jgi:hypothetical protein
MADVKIQMKIGEVEFSGEGEQAWVGKQLEKILNAAPTIAASAARRAPTHSSGAGAGGVPADSNAASQTLAKFLRDKNAAMNQVKKFLATAVWLQAKGKNRLTTGEITRALKDSNQSRLGNPADCLNKNVSKGFCEKDGKEFFVTTEGMASL